MNKRLLSLLLIFGLALNISGCTSGGGKDEAEVAEANDETFAEEGEGDFAEESSDEGDAAEETTDDTQVAESSDEAAPEDEGDDLSIDDEEVAEGENTEGTGEEVAATETKEGEDELSLDDEALPEDVAATEEAPIAEPEAAAPTDVAAAPEATDEPVFEESAPDAAPAESTEVASNSEPPVLESNPPPAPAANFLPLLKVKDSAFTANDGTTLNRVYFARPGESTNEIAQKLYGSDRSADLKKWNSNLASRPAKAGDKIYYASALNPQDSKMLTYYEEQNIPSQTYVSKSGDNIRAVSKDLLGFDNAWKEVWATNASVESKGDISEGIELRYWPEGSTATPVTQASNEPPPPAPDTAMPTELPQAPPAQAGTMPDGNPDPFAQQPGSELPPATADANDPLAPPPLPEGTDATAAGTMGAVPSDTMEPPPPPPMPAEPKAVVKRDAPEAMDAEEEAMDPDTTMALGVAGLLLIAAAALFVFIRKNRAKKLDMTQTTQI